MSFIDHIVITLSAKLCDKKNIDAQQQIHRKQPFIYYHWDLINCILQFCKNANCMNSNIGMMRRLNTN